jgi:hypothetical protein
MAVVTQLVTHPVASGSRRRPGHPVAQATPAQWFRPRRNDTTRATAGAVACGGGGFLRAFGCAPGWPGAPMWFAAIPERPGPGPEALAAGGVCSHPAR